MEVGIRPQRELAWCYQNEIKTSPPLATEGALMRVHAALLLFTGILIGTAFGLHVDGYDLGWWLMVAAGFFGSWAFVPLGPPSRSAGAESSMQRSPLSCGPPEENGPGNADQRSARV
jgi:hypothetical protein